MWVFFQRDLFIISEGHSSGKILIKKLAGMGLPLLTCDRCENFILHFLETPASLSFKLQE